MDKLLTQIRNRINRPRKQYQLLKNMGFWNQLCASMDVIWDTETAIRAFEKKLENPDRGELYLRLFGFLQSLFVQQDAVDNLCESLQINEKHNNYPVLIKIRDIRNKTAGHPTKKGREKVTHHYIAGVFEDLESFKFVTYDKDEFKIEEIKTKEFISQQKQFLKEILEKVAVSLKKEEREHKERYMSQKLSKCFPVDLNYCFEKIYEGTEPIHSSRVYKAKMQIAVLRKALDEFKNFLGERGIEIETYSSIKFEYEHSNYPLQALSEHFVAIYNGEQSKLNDNDARVYTDSLKIHFEDLKTIAVDIDKEYEDLSEV